MVLLNRFGPKNMKNYVEFNSGADGIKIRANSVRGRPLQKNRHLYKKIDPFRYLCPPANSAYGELTNFV